MKFRHLPLIFSLMIAASTDAQISLTYQKPPAEILQLAEYERAPSVTLDENNQYAILLYRDTYKSLDDLNQDELRLGGLRINPKTFIASTMNYSNNMKVLRVGDKEPRLIAGMPADPKIGYTQYSPDQKKLAFTQTTSNGVELWVLDIASAMARKLTGPILNSVLGRPFEWYANSSDLLINVLPIAGIKLLDTKNELPKGPIVSESKGVASQNPTYQDLLKNPMDEQNFISIATSSLQKVDATGNLTLVMPEDLYASNRMSPDGNYLLVTTLKRPFSYIVPYSRFAQLTAVYTMKGERIATVEDTPVQEIIPKGFDATRTGRRSANWRDDRPATLVFAQALDEGDPARKVPFRDEIFSWDAPFTQPPVSLAKTTQRYSYIRWADETTAILYDRDYAMRRMKAYIIDPSKPGAKPRLLYDRGMQDAYGDPGEFETTLNAYNRRVLLKDKNNLYLIGDGFTRDGQFPFVDELNLKTLKTKRLYTSPFTDRKETILTYHRNGEILTQLQSKNEFPNYFLKNIKTRKSQQLTFNENPFRSIEKAHKEVISYPRYDGLNLTGTLYLPVNYEKGKKYPLLIWAYPTEFKDAASAAQNTQNPNDFTFPYYGSFVYWITRGYVVLDDASFPIVGEGDAEPNDTFIEQLVGNAKAAIDAVDKLGYIDRNRVGVGGHSYGAFMTANLLTHSDLFAGGIARSGAYNRTLTPFGFQNEKRNFWDSPGVYNQMSPFMNAAKMKTPMLLIHGEADNNPGTFTLQTERYFQALKGLGAPVRMVILPKESHSYVAKENVLHLLWEQDQFLEKYVKGVEAK